VGGRKNLDQRFKAKKPYLIENLGGPQKEVIRSRKRSDCNGGGRLGEGEKGSGRKGFWEKKPTQAPCKLSQRGPPHENTAGGDFFGGGLV